MPDSRTISLARNWAGWFGTRLAAEEMGVSEATIIEWVGTAASKAPAARAAARSAAVQMNTPAQKPDTESAVGRKPRYTPEQKQAALAKVAEIGLAKTARETGISVGSLIKWRQENLAASV